MQDLIRKFGKNLFKQDCDFLTVILLHVLADFILLSDFLPKYL